MTSMRSWVIAGLAGLSAWAFGTETENANLEVLPTPGKVVIDGKCDDWDLSGGVFVCGDVETVRDQYGVWVHAMYDNDGLYILARWEDQTPLNNPGSVKGDYGFNGDCLQVRFVMAPDVNGADVLRRGNNDNDAPEVRTSHWTAWRDRDGLDALQITYGRRFNEGSGDGKADGGAQAFTVNPDGKGYTQEMRLPWKALTRDGKPLAAGARFLMTVEPNFLVQGAVRLTIKDIFRAGSAVDRVFTFRAYPCWGIATLASQGHRPLRPVRLADGREFPVRLQDGLPVVDWTGLIKSREPTGFKDITFTMPEDGYVSLNLWSTNGTVARQLLSAAFYTKGEHTVKWDGLTTPSFRRPGVAVPPGDYAWKGIWHKGFGLTLKGWACNGVSAPWAGPAVLDCWGGDHGNPVACAADSNQVYLGWASAEGGKALVACDLNGFTKWRNTRGGIGSASLIAADAGTVYVVNRAGQYAPVGIYRVDAKRGGYTEWSDLHSTDMSMKNIFGDVPGIPGSPTAIAAAGGRVFASFGGTNAVAVMDAATGKVLKMLVVPNPGAIAASSADQVYVVSGGRQVLAVDVNSGAATPVVDAALEGDGWVCAMARDRAGTFYLGVRKGTQQVLVYSAQGKLVRAIGRKGGRPLLGLWQPDGMLEISGLAVDASNKLWVAEDDGTPRRVSVWNTGTGAFEKEFFGASGYGAGGGAINPVDPAVMVGQGCEWRLDPQSGRARCVGVITREGMGNSRFGFGPKGRLYLAVTEGTLHGQYPVYIFERLGDGQYKLRSALRPGNAKTQTPVSVWADANDDGVEQPEETRTFDLKLGAWIEGWYMPMAPDLSFYGTLYQVKVTGWTKCGAPEYDLGQAVKITDGANVQHRGGMGAQLGHGCADGRYMLFNGGYGATHSTFDCYEIATGKLLWTYPNNFTGVHGSHAAPGPEVGLIRGAFDICGTARLPKPVGCIWVIPTNKGEWHVLTEDGYYLTKFFEGDPTRMVFPDKAVPGTSLDRSPPGAGEEAFGGSISQTTDGRLFLQVGHTAYWNVQVTGLENIAALPGGGRVSIGADDVVKAEAIRGVAMQESSGPKRWSVKRGTAVFTGDLNKDFKGHTILSFEKNDGAGVRAAMSWDDQALYVGWEVQDDTPWVNGADAPEFMYARGDTVDLQLATDPQAKKDRTEAGPGDLRLSIGPFQASGGSKVTAVLYRKVSAEKHPKSFSSGVVKDYVMDSVTIEDSVKPFVKVTPGKKALVEAAIPVEILGLRPASGLSIRGDIGVTHGDKAGKDTVLRTYWSNQDTGLVSDEVFELRMAPKNWGEVVFEAAPAP